MEMSPDVKELATALAKAQGQIEGAVKDSANPFFKSKYADLQSIWNACRKPLSDNGLSILQSPSTEATGDGLRVSVETLLLHASGQWVRGIVTVSAKDDSPQAAGSCITYLKRYALQSFVGVAPEDDDAEAAEARNKPAYVVTSSTKAMDSSEQRTHTSIGDTLTTRLKAVKTGRAGSKGEFVTEAGEAFLCYDVRAVAFAEQACQDGVLVTLTIARSTSGNRYVKTLKRAEPKPVDENDAIDREILEQEETGL